MLDLLMNILPSWITNNAETRPTPSSEIATEAFTATFSAKPVKNS